VDLLCLQMVARWHGVSKSRACMPMILHKYAT
jgi:hypothetical protein